MSKRVLCSILLGLVFLFTCSWAAAQTSPPTITKDFSNASVPINSSTTLTFTISNPNPATDLTGVSFTDNMPSGLIIANPDSLNGSCDTSFVSLGVSSLSLTGYVLPAASSCSFSVDVLATSGGTKVNTTDPITSNEGGTGGTATAAVDVVLPVLVVSKNFGAASIPLHATTSLNFTVANNGGATATGIAFTDALPPGLVVASPNGLIGSCPAVISAAGGSNSVTFNAAVFDPGANCSFSVNVTGNAAGTANNTIATISSNETGPVPATAAASLIVVAPPTIAKSFGTASIPLSGTTSLTFTITNPNASTSATGIAFTDTLPPGLVVATPNGLTGNCGGGTITATAGTGSASLSGATLAASASCVFSVNVTGTTVGAKNNITGAVTSLQGGTGNTASASVGVAQPAPPTIAKAFGAVSIPLNASTALTFTITNPNSVTALSGIAFTDALPAGLVIATPNGLTGSCGGGTITATAGSGSASLVGASLAASGSCAFSVNVTGTTAGTKNNTTGTIVATESSGGLTASASLTVAAVPSISAGLAPPVAAVNSPITLTFTLTNSNATLALTGLAFSDALPAGLVVATPNALSNTCGGTVTAAAGSGSVSLAGGSLAGATSCTLSVNVVTGSPGSYSTTTSAVTATNAGTGNTATASVLVLATPYTVPTLALWGLLLLAAALVMTGRRARHH